MKLSQLSGGLAKNYLKNIVKYKMGEEILLPYFATFYLTLRCNYACSFCDDGSAKQKYPDLKMDELNTEKTKKVLSILKNKCSSIYFTGGEPFLRKDLLDLCKFSKKIGFNPVSVNTNGFLLQKNLEVLDNIDNLVISLSSLDPVKYSKIVGRPISCFDIVMKNILIANSLKKKKGFEFVINCVVTEDSLLDAENVMNFCFQNKINFAVVPAMVGVYPDKDLLNSKAYRLFIDKIIAKKKNGNPVFNSYKYLQIIKNFKNFSCQPSLTPHVYPDGSLFYPCQLLKSKVNLLEIGDYDKAIQEGRRKFGGIPLCDNRCHLSCYIEPSLATKNPLNFL
ncbi:radical SAM protein [archaeon]|jgi:MoaA/NifB/PqqE/SkfB family radical SAM enzyme|nr:radical SAM protein [archaeon]MBT3730503.1 radical SAM protein [archaeon]MBT4669431.1 radical SAM protein [archaeon]MBT5029816.1 radical SAM protein [archaeon]MBT5288029.1 radical SAM protein [archaeon]